MLGMPTMQVDHQLVFEQQGNQTTHLVEIDPVAMQTLELDALQNVPNGAAQQRLVRQGSVVGVDPRAFSALGLEAPQREVTSNLAAKLPSSFTPPRPLPSEDRCFLEVVVGNHHKGLFGQTLGDLFHEWTMYVMLPEFQVSKWKMIECVVYNLDPMCNPNVYTKRSPKLELTSSSKEPFSVTCTIHWNPVLGVQPTVVAYDLVFAEAGGRTSTTIGVSPRRLRFFA
jgi:hypothetical protein